MTGELPAQMASHVENVSIWCRHHENTSLQTAISVRITSSVQEIIIYIPKEPGGSFNIKIMSYQYKDSHYKDTMAWDRHIYNGNHHTWNDSLYIERGPKASFNIW